VLGGERVNPMISIMSLAHSTAANIVTALS
jgi:hypothetical protein